VDFWRNLPVVRLRLRQALILSPGAAVRSLKRLNADANAQSGLLDRIEQAESPE
jgi:hypothetical protein